MRSLLEKYDGRVQNQRIGQGFIHSCQDLDEYRACPVCQVFGVPGERNFSLPTRIVVRDVHMSDAEAQRIDAKARTDLPYTEVKTEVSIDRVTSAANPRQMERVPAGAAFGPAELVYSIYSGDDCDPRRDVARLVTVVEGMQLLEDDYLGGLGSRGSGKVRLTGIRVLVRSQDGYLAQPREIGSYADVPGLAADLAALQASVLDALDLT
jgi:CRISPR-associated protein Csm3